MLKLILSLVVLVPSFVTPVKSEDVSYSDRMFQEGLLAQGMGDALKTKNAWTKYRAYCRLSPASCWPKQRDQVETYFDSLVPSTLVVTESKLESLSKIPGQETVLTPAVQTKKSPPKKQIIKTKVATQPTVNAAELVRQAEQAREQGQLEYALRLYQLAEKVDVSKMDYLRPIEEIMKLME